MIVDVRMQNFLDESGEFDETVSPKILKRLTMGGYFAPWASVQQLCEEWRAALDIECLSEFHMKEIASDEHRYPDWPVERQQRLDRFVDILIRHAEVFCAYSYAVITPGRAFEEAYHQAFNRALIRASTIAAERKSRIRVVYAQTSEVSHELIGRFFDRLHWGDELDGYAVLRSRDNPALQAAEIPARGLKRFMQDGLITHSFSRVLTSGKPFEVWPSDPLAAIQADGLSPRLSPGQPS